MSNVISHIGTIDSIREGMVCVRITQSSACASCKVASVCNSAESKEKIIDVVCADWRHRNVGEQVTVMAAQSVGMKAVVIAFVVPTILVLLTITITLSLVGSEMTAAITGLAIMLPYYIVLYTLRGRLQRTLTFYLGE